MIATDTLDASSLPDVSSSADLGAGRSASAFPWGASATPALAADATAQLVAALPEDTMQLIVREAYLFRAGEVILQARQDAKARHDLVSASRPPFLAFRRGATKDAFNASLESATNDLSLYEKALDRNASAMKRLRKCAELHIEDWLRQNDAVYYAGLVSEELVADWHRCLTRLESELTDFILAVGCARNALVSSRPNAQGEIMLSDVSRKAFKRATEVGALLVADVVATNALAAERDRHLEGTAFAGAFPRLPSFDFASSLHEAAGLAVPLLQQKISVILAQCAELRALGLPALLQQVQGAETQHRAVKEGYLVGVWQGLRQFALDNYVDEQDLNEVARATEKMFEDGIFA
jgi:hypothetical protein